MSQAERAIGAIEDSVGGESFVVAQLGQSLDGRIALPSGESKYINGPAGLDHLHRLRAAVDAVVVGVGTVLTDDPLLTVRRVQGSNPARVIIDANGRLKVPRKCLARDGVPVIVIRRRGVRGADLAGAEQIFLDGDEGGIPCDAIVQALAEHGLNRLLVEGGASTVSRFFEEGQLDRLHIIVSPVLLGEGKTGLSFRAPAHLASAVRVAPQIFLLGSGEILIDCPLWRKMEPRKHGK